MKPYKVLVVDDATLMRNVIKKIFAKDPNFEVVGTAKSGLEALDMIVMLQPDLITLDVEMPEMDGITTLKHIMSDDPIPVVMVSNYTDEGTEIALQSIELGAADFFHKSLLYGKESGTLFEDEFLLRCKVAVRHKFTGLLDTAFKTNDQSNQLLMESLSQLVKIEEDLALVYEELTHSLRSKRSLILKFSKSEERFVYTYGDGELLGRFNISPGDIIGKECNDIFSVELANYQLPFYEQVWNGEKLVSYEMRWRGLQLLTHLRPIHRAGQVIGGLSISFDISSQRQMEERISFLADHDLLTKLPNRVTLSKWLEQMMEQVDKPPVAVISIDLDQFKLINEALGHSIGDRILQILSRRMKNIGMNHKDYFVARVGGDEFICVFPIDERGAEPIVEHLTNAVMQPIRLFGHELYIRCSIGISLSPENGNDAESLITNADIAMFAARKQGGNQRKYWDPSLNEQLQRRMLIEGLLQKAIELNEFTLVYQPQIDNARSEVHGIESLIRWNNPRLGNVSPTEFIPVAEETDIIIEIGKWVLKEACQFNKKLQLAGMPKMTVAVNLSSKQFLDQGLKTIVEEILTQTGLEAQYLELEITESMAMDVDITLKTMKSLKELGVKLAMDDFGTGYSSLSYLKEFPLDTLKIDQSFVKEIASNPISHSIVKTIVLMSQSLDLEVIAEGVEDAETVAILASFGCNRVQGYYFSRPLAADDAILAIQRLILSYEGN